MKPRISVIVPVWNRESLITRCLDSIAQQTYKPHELLVVDNNSSDNTYKVVESWMQRNEDSGITFKLIKESRKGATAARQKGLENSRGDYLLFFDSDDEMHVDLIEKAESEIQKEKSVDIVCWKCRIHLLNGKNKIPAFDVKSPMESHLINTLLRTQGYMVRREFLVEIGGWQKPLQVWNDFELGLRILLNSPKIIGIPEVLAEIYSQKESITGICFKSKEGEWEKTLEEMERVTKTSCHLQKERILRILAYRRVVLAALYYREGNKAGAKKLLDESLKDKKRKEKILLKFSYHYTRRGMRGAWRLIGRGL